MIFMPGNSNKETIEVKHKEKSIDILIVDDQPYIPDLLSVELTQDGYLVKRAGNSESMWESLRDMQPDLLLLDHYLNGTESWNVLLDINQRRPEIPVLIYVIKHFDALYRLKQTISEVLSLKGKSLREWGKINLIEHCA